MRASRFISERLNFRGRITVAATAVSFFVIILSLMVLGGFKLEIRRGISSLMGDVQMTASSLSYYGEGEPISADASYLPRLRQCKGVEELTPAIYRTAVVKNGSEIEGVLIKALPSADSSLTVAIPSTLADKLGLKEGDRMLTYFIGDRVKIRNFTVREIYRDLLRADDKMLVFANLGDLQRVNGWDSTMVSALEIKLSDYYRSNDREKTKAAELSTLTGIYASEGEAPLVATAASQRFSRLFDWLNLLDFNVLAILLLMILVAGFNMVSGLLIMLFRHTGTIGTLKALGMDNRRIAMVFLRVASGVVLKGMAIGGGAALLFALVQSATHFLRLNPENYFVSFVPVAVNLPQILLVCAIAYGAIMLLLLLPSIFISRVDPSETVRVK